jgi:transposase
VEEESMELTEEVKALLLKTAKDLKGSARRLFMARTVQVLGEGGQRLAERELGWNRGTIRKGTHELESGIVCYDAFSWRGRKRAEEHLPNLLSDLRAIVDGQSQADPQFRTNRLYTKLTVAEVRRQLMEKFGYSDEELPTEETIGNKLNTLGYSPKKVAKTQPQKKIPETDAIFDQVKQINEAADADPQVIRISIDTKATMKVGPFSRGGKSRVRTKAADHDFDVKEKVTPVGIFLPTTDELFLYAVTSHVTADCLVDRLIQWWEREHSRFPDAKMLVINLDNGPENHSHRTQFMQRLVEFVEQYHISVRLAYYPPYHSKYNPVERCFGILEMHWNGTLLDSVDAVLKYAKSMVWKGTHPVVELVTTAYQTGVKLTPRAMQALETRFQRLPGLDKWFVDILSPDQDRLAPLSQDALVDPPPFLCAA